MRKIVQILFRVLAVIVVLLLLWALLHRILNIYEATKLEQTGQYVIVDEKKMNVYSVGEGDTTIVLMPGLGTTAPVLDYEPLATELAKDYQVVIVEPFGYGWSACTTNERSVENIVEELREALKEIGVTGEVVLMPHSASGIYATWYANIYPEEVRAIIGIDCALPRQVEYFGGANPKVPQIAKLAHLLGVQRVLCMLSPTMFISDDSMGVYTKENLDKQLMLSNKVGYNTTVIDETNAIAENIEKTFDMEFSEDLPLLFFTRDTRKAFYETYICNRELQNVVVFDAGHYMHWTKAVDMVQEIKKSGILER